MLFESKLGKFEADSLVALIGQRYKYIVHDEDGSLINQSGIVISTESDDLAIFSGYWYSDSDEPSVEYFELARFELMGSEYKYTKKLLRTGCKTQLGHGQLVRGVFVVRSFYKDIEYATDIFKEVKDSYDVRYEYSESMCATLDFVTDSGIVLVLEEMAIYIHCEHPYFELFRVDFIAGLEEIEILPQTSLFDLRMQEGQFKFELLSVEGLALSL